MLATLLLVAAPWASTQASVDATVYWKNKPLDLSSVAAKLPEDVAGPLAGQIGRYAEWAEAEGYELGLSKDGRVLLFAESVPTLRDRMKLVEKTLTALDEVLAAPDRSGSDETFEPGPFGQGHHVPDSEPILLFEVDTPEAYGALTQRLGVIEPTLVQWAEAQGKKPGFFEGRLSAAGWQRIPRDFDLKDVWRTKNELVNRLARLYLYRSYGPQPTWFSLGLAWRIEMETMGTLYSFPYRSEFIGVVEHEGWRAPLKSEFRKRKKSPLRMSEFTAWTRNTWSGEKAAIAWGIAEFLCEYRSEAVVKIAEDFRKLHKEGFRTTEADGTWSTNPSFLIPGERQLAVMEAHLGDGLLETLTTFLGNFKKPKKRR